MNYNRYLDIHLCTNNITTDLEQTNPRRCFFGAKGAKYFYEFTDDIMRQLRYRESKTEGFNFNNQNTGNCKVLRDVELTNAADAFLTLTSALDTTGGGQRVSYAINEELKQLRYISCMVSIENLQKNMVYPQLQALMLWISDPHTVNKLRINCHGSGTTTDGFTMGDAELSPQVFIDALVRHGLTRPSTHVAPVLGLAQGARWKLDSEKAACENCNKKFGVFTRQHHCRRCGGLFCDACSSKKADLAVALSGQERGGVIQQTATVRNVKKARVCEDCYNVVASPAARALAEDPVLGEVFGAGVAAAAGGAGLTNYGLKTMTLALCMGAKADDIFSVERDPRLGAGSQQAGTFVRDSLAGRLLGELRRHNLHGIKVAASNQVVRSTHKGILTTCGIDCPSTTNSFDKHFRVVTEDSVKENRLEGNNSGTFHFPAYIWGKRPSLEARYDTLAREQAAAHTAARAAFKTAMISRSKTSATPAIPAVPPMFSKDITVSPCGRSLDFSSYEYNKYNSTVQNEFLNHWKFFSWHTSVIPRPQQAGGNSSLHTLRLTAPPRVTNITFVPGPPGSNLNQIRVTGRENESFKQYKSYEVS